MGRISAEPRIHQIEGLKILCFSLVTTEKLKRNGDGEIHEEYHQIRINARLVNPDEIIIGKMVYIQGRLQTRHFFDDRQVKHYKAEVIAYSIEPVEMNQSVL